MQIFNKDIDLHHPHHKGYATDFYYTSFARKLGTVLEQETVAERHKPSVLRAVSIRLALYFEDIVADSGQWKMFSHLCMQLYGYPVPMYHEQEEYYPDEPSMNAVRYIVWQTISEEEDILLFADHHAYLEISRLAYTLMDQAFEEAPVNGQLAEDVNGLIRDSSSDFNAFREALKWIADGCYCTGGKEWDAYFKKNLENQKLLDMMGPALAAYSAMTSYIFCNKTGPLALFCKDWLKGFCEVLGYSEYTKMIDNLEGPVVSTWLVESIKGNMVHLRSLEDQEIDITLDALNAKPEMFKNDDGMLAGFIRFRGKWELNGTMSMLNTEGRFGELQADFQEEHRMEYDTPQTAELMLGWTGGRQLLYFKDKAEEDKYLDENFHYAKGKASQIAPGEGDFPSFFIANEEDDHTIFFAYGAEKLIKDPANPYYDEKEAQESAICVLWDKQCASSAMARYVVAHGFLPDAANSQMFSRTASPEQLQHDMDFFMRTMRRDDY